MYHFIRASDDNYVKVEIHGKRKCELRLVVPAKYNDFAAKIQTAKILDAELSKRKELSVSLVLFTRKKEVSVPFQHINKLFFSYLVSFLFCINFFI